MMIFWIVSALNSSFSENLNYPIRQWSSQQGSFITQPVQTVFLFKSIWIRPQGSLGCQKIRIFFQQIKLLSFCANIAFKRHKLRKIVKIEKMSKTLVFLEYFEHSSIWGQY